MIRCLLGTFPVLLFLACLIYLDSYKLVSARSVLLVILAGAASAVASYWANTGLLSLTGIGLRHYTRYGAPVVEEFLKAGVLVYLIRSKKVGFLVDAAIYGFAVGTGFAVIENLYYLQARSGTSLTVWVIRGFGTATMHGGATALFAIISKLLSDLRPAHRHSIYLPGIMVAIGAHSFHNHFVLPPLISTAGILLVFPALVIGIFRKSEKSLQHWLGVGFDADVELLELLDSGAFPDSRIGRYLNSLRRSFSGPVVADMLCYLRIQAELAVRAKGAFLMRDSGFPVPPDPEIEANLQELLYLERQVGPTGRQAMAPFVHVKSQDYWQLYQLAGKNA